VESSNSRENDVEKVKGSASLLAAESENGPNPSTYMGLMSEHPRVESIGRTHIIRLKVIIFTWPVPLSRVKDIL